MITKCYSLALYSEHLPKHTTTYGSIICLKVKFSSKMGYVGPIGVEILASKSLKPHKNNNFYPVVTDSIVYL